MNRKSIRILRSQTKGALVLFVAFALGIFPSADAQESAQQSPAAPPWQEQAIDYARIMSHVKWTPVADGMPRRSGHFEKGTEYTGVPYSSVKYVGRYIGFDIFLKTFLAAVENPQSVLYTENLLGEVKNAECYYGKVCSSYTCYALQCGLWYVSRLHNPPYREGVSLVEPHSARGARPGDFIYTPPAKKGGGSHVELITEISKDENGSVTHVRIEESAPPTTRNGNLEAKEFDKHISSRNRKLYRITDHDAWREGNRADAFLFPNYEEDSATPRINRVLLLDRGDWVPYETGQPVKINVMDRDEQGVKSLVIRRGNEVVERIENPGQGVVERTFSECGDYTAHCLMKDGSESRACEFAVCDLQLRLPEQEVSRSEPWEIEFSSEHMEVIIVYLKSVKNGYDEHNLFPTDEDRKRGRITVPPNLIRDEGRMQIWLMGENRYGRLKKLGEVMVKD